MPVVQGLVQFLVGGTSITKIGRVAAELHQGQPFVVECPQDRIPGLAGRRMFQLMYGDGRDIEKDDVEIIRRDLERGLNTKAWSATFDDNGRITFYPQKIGLDQLPPARGNMYEDDPSPGDYDGGDWDDDGDWDHGFPEFSPHGRGNPYVYQSDRHHPEPIPRPGRQRNSYHDFGHGDRYQHIPESLPRRGPFSNNFDPRYPPTQPTPRRDGPSNPFSNSDPRGYPTPRRNNRRSSANDYDRDYQYEDFSPRYANDRRHTFGHDVHGRFAWASPNPRNRGHFRDEVVEVLPGYRLPPGMSPSRDRDGTLWELSMYNPRNVPRPEWTSIQNSLIRRDAGRTQGKKSGRFWRVVRSFFGHT